MAFLNGRATFTRFKVNGANPNQFHEEHLERLAEYKAGRQRIAAADGIEIGWTAGDHIFDTEFDLAKNIIADALLFELRIDTDKLPTDLMRAYYAIELKALSATNPSGLPSARQKREAKEFARDRLEQEAKDGRFKRRKTVPLLWDSHSNELWFGATSMTHIDRVMNLFNQSFGHDLQMVTSGTKAFELAEGQERTQFVDDSEPSTYVASEGDESIAWIIDSASRDFLGNEFMLWLWHYSEQIGDTIPLFDKTECTYMIARSMNLECPRGQTGSETISHEGPSRLPEAKQAIRHGKLPRKMGMTVVRHSYQYEFMLHAETLAIGAARLPNPSEENSRARQEERIGQLRHLLETTDLLYNAYCDVRLSAAWPDTLKAMQRWLHS